MRKIEIKNRKETDVTDEALYALNKESHGMWTEQGLDAPWMHLTFPEFQEAIRGVPMFVRRFVGCRCLWRWMQRQVNCWGCIASELTVRRVGAMDIDWLLHRQPVVRVLPRGCWFTKQSASGRQAIAI